MGKSISTALSEYLGSDSDFLFPLFHIRDIGHQAKNAQVSLEPGKHFDGQNACDATDLSLLRSTWSDEVAEH